MRRIIATTVAAFALAAVSANADTMMKETTTSSSTTYSGTVSALQPSDSTIILKTEKQEPSKYVFTEKTMFVDPAGTTVTKESITNQPVTVYTEKQGDQMVVTKVVTKKSMPAPMIEKKTTTTVEPVQ